MSDTNQERFQRLLLGKLMHASLHGDVKDIKRLIKMGVDVNQAEKNNGITPLYVSCMCGHSETLKVLIAGGGLVNKANNNVIHLYLLPVTRII